MRTRGLPQAVRLSVPWARRSPGLARTAVVPAVTLVDLRVRLLSVVGLAKEIPYGVLAHPKLNLIHLVGHVGVALAVLVDNTPAISAGQQKDSDDGDRNHDESATDSASLHGLPLWGWVGEAESATGANSCRVFKCWVFPRSPAARQKTLALGGTLCGVSDLHGYDALILPADYEVEPSAFRDEAFSDKPLAAMDRHVALAGELSRCRYFTEEERSMHLTMDQGVTTSFEMNLPDAGATRDMLGLLRQLFGDNERSSFASMVAILRAQADAQTPEGQKLLDVLGRYELIKEGVLDSWDVQPSGTENSPQPPLVVFLDWMYGEYLHSDEEKAQRIRGLDGGQGLYEWQFHWVAERLSMLFTGFAQIVKRTLELQSQPSS